MLVQPYACLALCPPNPVPVLQLTLVPSVFGESFFDNAFLHEPVSILHPVTILKWSLYTLNHANTGRLDSIVQCQDTLVQLENYIKLTFQGYKLRLSSTIYVRQSIAQFYTFFKDSGIEFSIVHDSVPILLKIRTLGDSNIWGRPSDPILAIYFPHIPPQVSENTHTIVSTVNKDSIVFGKENVI